MNATIRQRRELRRAIAKARADMRALQRNGQISRRERIPAERAESWPAIAVGLAIAIALMVGRAWGAL